jgi:hypothetical protein
MSCGLKKKIKIFLVSSEFCLIVTEERGEERKEAAGVTWCVMESRVRGSISYAA